MTREHSAAEEATDWFERYARIGYLVKGLVYLMIGGLAFQFALGVGGGTVGPSGALASLLRQPLGQILLSATAVGLFGYALWRLGQGVFDLEHKGLDARGLLKRFAYLVAGFGYGGLGFEALRMVLGAFSGVQEDTTELWVGRVLDAPAGGWLVGAGALAMAALAINAAVVAVGRMYRKKLDLAAMNRFMVIVAEVTAIAGLLGRGTVFGLVGLLLAEAAWRRQAEEAGSSAEALDRLLAWPAGSWLLAAVASGLVAYGVFALVQARYRRMDVEEEEFEV